MTELEQIDQLKAQVNYLRKSLLMISIPTGVDDYTKAHTIAINAFPATGEYSYQQGMTLRDYFAAKAMQVVLADCKEFPDENWRIGVAIDAYQMADAMLKAREQAK